MSAIRLLLVAALFLVTVESAPFFDAIYDAINGNARRSYGYSGYGNGNYGYGGYGNPYGNGYGNPQASGYGYGSYGGYEYRPRHEKPSRQEKTFKDICRVHFTASAEFPGKNGIVCPY